MRKTNYLPETKGLTTIKTLKTVSIKHKSGCMPILDNLLIKDGNLYFTDLESTITVYNFFKNKEILALVNRTDFFKILEAIGNETYELTQEVKEIYFGNGGVERTSKVFIKTDQDTFTLDASADLEEYPEITSNDETYFFKTVLDEVDITNFYRALPFISKEEMRPAMMGVYFNHDIVATNGHQMFKVKSKANINSVVIIPGSVLEKIKPFKLTKALLYEAINGDNKTYKINFGNISITFRSIKQKFPDYNSVWPIDTKGSAEFSKKDVLKSIKKVSIVQPSDRKILLEPGLNTWNVKTKDVDTGTEALSKITVTTEGKLENFAVNIGYFTDILKQVNKENVKIDFTSPTKAIILNDNFLLMPVRI